MSLSLDEFVNEVKDGIERFSSDYRAKHKADPECYPLTMQAGNEGLWYEFFMDHLGESQDV